MSSNLKLVKENPELILREINISNYFLGHFRKVKGLSHKKLRELNKFHIYSLSYNCNTKDVFIPGSSIKGAIRTAILNKYRGKVSRRVDKGKELEKSILGFKNPSQDIFKRLKVSDFLPKSKIVTKIVYAVNVKKDGHRASGPYQLFEVLDKGEEFVGNISIVSDLDKNPPVDLSFEAIEEALIEFYSQRFKEDDQVIESLEINYGLPVVGIPIKIGRHSGAESVTIDGFRKIKIRKGKYSQESTEATTMWFASEDKDIQARSSLLPFARACLLSLDKNLDKKQFLDKNVQKIESRVEKKKQKLDLSGLQKRFKVKK